MPEEYIIRDIIRATREVFNRFLDKVSSFQVLSPEVIPYGLKPHTRSICWLAEQVIVQNIEAMADKLRLKNFEYPKSDISIWDVRFSFKQVYPDHKVHINIKVANVMMPQRKNDFASVKTLLRFFDREQDPILLCVIFPFQFQNTNIKFIGKPIVINYTWIDDFVVNPRNEHLQALFNCGEEVRTSQEFVKLIISKARQKGLKV